MRIRGLVKYDRCPRCKRYERLIMLVKNPSKRGRRFKEYLCSDCRKLELEKNYNEYDQKRRDVVRKGVR